jgi:hypothetical protein
MIACGHPEFQRFGRNRNGSIRFRCKVCGKTFTEPQEKPLGNMYVETADAKLALRMLVEGASLRSTSRITGLDRNTICKLLVKFGNACRDFLAACWCVRRSLDDLTRCEVLVRIIARYPVVYRAVVGVIQSAEASESESVSHNASEPSSAPLRSGSGQPANNGEASTGRDATSVCSDRAPRGVRG